MKRIKVIVPVSVDIWNEPVKNLYNKYKDIDTEITVANITKGAVSVECRYDAAWSELFTVLEAEKAEAEGCDGIIIYCFGEPGLLSAKEKLNIPVVGISEASVHFASMLGKRFSIITVGPSSEVSAGYLKDNLERYDLAHKCASIRVAAIEVLDLTRDPKREKLVALAEAKKAVEEDGADTLVLGCGGMLGMEEKMRKELGVPVVVPGIAALKICEDLIEMGLAQSKRCFALPPEKDRKL
jgi:allantoin racemase